jgi:integrase
MASVKFYLSKPKATSSSIFFRLNYGAFEIVNDNKRYLPLQYHTDEVINPAFWNAKKGEAKQISKFPQYPEFNTRLNNIRDIALNVLRKLKNDGVNPSNDILRKEFDAIFKKHKDQTEKNAAMELMAFIPHFIKTSTKTAGTKRTYNQVLKNLQEYEHQKNAKLTFDRIDIDFYNGFVLLLQSKGFSPNTVGIRIKVLKTFMNEAYERNLHKNTDYKKKAFVRPSEETKSVYLNEKELAEMYKLDLSANKKLDHVRDWFLIGACTGLRFSDLERLSKDNIKDNSIEIKMKKTSKSVVIPLHTMVKNILEKHDYLLPKVISNQKFNEYIKEVAEKARIDEDILIEETKGAFKITRTEKKYNLVSAHTARRSFATNAFLAEVPTIQIMKMTGHATEKVFLNYIKISEHENAEKLRLHPFFNKMIVQ